MGEIDTIIDGRDVEPKGLVPVLGEEARDRKPVPDNVLPEPAPGRPAITRPGMVWTLGVQRLFYGDSTKPQTYDELLGLGLDQPDVVELVFTDPPYNVAIDGHVSGLGKRTHREFAMASEEMSTSEFRGFLSRCQPVTPIAAGRTYCGAC